MKNSDLITDLRNAISIEAKNGVEFICSASIVWLLITLIWTLDYASFERSVFTFYVGVLTIPLAFGISKIIKTSWKEKSNPLKPVGLWFNFAQLFYFPFLFFFVYHMPDYFIMAYAIITGAHFFPFSWFYRTKFYAIIGGAISVGSFLMAMFLPVDLVFLIPLSTSVLLLALAIALVYDYKKKLAFFEASLRLN